MFPELINEIVAGEELEVVHVIRNGPRYWVGKVRRGEENLILKAVIGDEPWKSPISGTSFRPSDQLRAEILTLRALNRLGNSLAGTVPTLGASSTEPSTWTLRSVVGGDDMSGTIGPFIFHPRFFQTVSVTSLIDYILSYQRLTPELYDFLIKTPHTDQTDLASKMVIGDLDNPMDYLATRSKRVNEYLVNRIPLHDAQTNMLSHGEVYPPHIFFDEGQICFIDWENASLNNPMSDLASVWVRAFNNPEWQAAFQLELWQRKLMEVPGMEEIWDIEVVFQSSCSLNYLYWSQIESLEEKLLAVTMMGRNIDRILG